MSYPFETTLAQARADLEKHGFQEVHSNVKVIRFQHATSGQEIYIDRDGKPGQQKVSFSFLPRDLAPFEGLPGASKIANKHSSNYSAFPKTLSRKGEMQHEGGRVVLEPAANYSSIINEIQRGS